MNLWNLHLLCVCTRQAAYRVNFTDSNHFYARFPEATQGVLTYVASMRTDISKTFYDINRQPSLTSLRFVLYPGHMGKSSFASVVEMRNAQSNELYVKNVNQLVCVSKDTRKPTPLPQWFREKFSAVIKGSPLIVPQFSLPPAEVVRHTSLQKVGYNDIDFYQHANFSTYLKFSIEAAKEAANRKGIFKPPLSQVLAGLLLDFKVKSVQMAFFDDANVENQLAVTTWQNPSNLLQIFADVALNENGKTINQGTIEFHEHKAD